MVFGGLANKAITNVHEHFLKRKLSNNDAKVHLDNPFLRVNIFKEKGAVFNAKGNLHFWSFCQDNSPIRIILRKNATFQIDGDFCIASGSCISVEENGFLKIGGKDVEADASIVNATIAVHKRIEIGKDCMITDNVTITDSNWHYVEFDGIPSPLQSDTIIGNHVWVCPGSSILKGTTIGNGCIIATAAVVYGGAYPNNSLVAGSPAKVIKDNCRWSRQRA